MITGKVNAVVRLLLVMVSPGMLPTNNDLLIEKHPDGAMKFDDLLLHGPEEFFGENKANEDTDSTLIRKITREISGTVVHEISTLTVSVEF